MNKPIHFFTNRLKQFREDRDWSQKQLAAFLTLQTGKGVGTETVNYWENQKRGANTETALNVASALKINVMELVERKSGE